MKNLFFFLILFSCNKPKQIEAAPVPQLVETTIVGFAILEDDFLVSSLDGPQQLATDNLEFGFSHDDARLWLKSENYKFSNWRNVKVGFELNEDVCFLQGITYKSRTPNYTEILFSNELSDFIFEHPSQRIFFHLNLNIDL